MTFLRGQFSKQFPDTAFLKLVWTRLAVEPEVDSNERNFEFVGEGLLGELGFKAARSGRFYKIHWTILYHLVT